MHTLFTIFVMIVMTSVVSAAPAVKTATSEAAPAVIMNELLSHMTALKKYMFSEDAFKDPKNQAEIGSHLKEFALAVQKSSHNPVLNQENFKFSWKVLQSHVTETERVFRTGNKSYARWMTQSTLSVCMSCHSQMPANSRSVIAMNEFNDVTMFTSDFDQAEFMFATRIFDKATVAYDQMIKSYDPKKLRYEQLQTALERQVAYYSRIAKDPKVAADKFRSYLAVKNIPVSLKENIKAWLKQFDNWIPEKRLNVASVSDKDLEAFVKKNLKLDSSDVLDASSPFLVNYLKVSGVLYEYLLLHPKSKMTPQVLYWLALCDRSVNYTFFFSLADMYLQECMMEYPASPIAKQCYKEYEDQTIAGYSGSSGTHLPTEVRSHLEGLKKMVDAGGKVDVNKQ